MLSLALAATLIASTGAAVATAWAVSDSLEQAGEVAKREERAAYLVGAVAVEVPQLRANLLAGAVGPRASAEPCLEPARRDAATLSATRAELPGLLAPAEMDVWRSVEPRLDAILARYDRTLEAETRGDGALAASLLDETAADARRIAADLDRFRRFTLDETAEAVFEIQAHAERTLRIALFGWLGLGSALAFVWVRIVRLVAAQRRALSAKVDALEAANRELEAFAGRVAHDMRNVLAPVQLGVSALERTSSDRTVHRIAQRIQRSSARGRDLVEGLLAFSRAGGQETSPQRADACEEISDVLDQLAEPIREADVRVTTKLPETALVAIAPALLHVVLVNVIGNAVKFMAGRQKRRLTIAAQRAGDRWTIDIADTGPGIPERELPRVFDALYRGARSTGRGIGLGLATVKRIVESRGGSVTIDSLLERGTTVTLVMPEADAKDPD